MSVCTAVLWVLLSGSASAETAPVASAASTRPELFLEDPGKGVVFELSEHYHGIGRLGVKAGGGLAAVGLVGVLVATQVDALADPSSAAVAVGSGALFVGNGMVITSSLRGARATGTSPALGLAGAGAMVGGLVGGGALMSLGEGSSAGVSAVQGAGMALAVGGFVGAFHLGRAQHRANADTVGVPAIALSVRPTPAGVALAGAF